VLPYYRSEEQPGWHRTGGQRESSFFPEEFLSPVLAQIITSVHKKAQTMRTDAIIPFSPKHPPERTGLTRKIGQQSLKTVEIY